MRPVLGAYGHTEVKSPNIDALAAKSLLFERAYCHVAVCNPSRASLMTGRRADTNHVWITEYWRTSTNATTIPQYFKENGYISVGIFLESPLLSWKKQSVCTSHFLAFI